MDELLQQRERACVRACVREIDERDFTQVMTLCYWVSRGFCACLAENERDRWGNNLTSEGAVRACNV